VKKNPTLMLLSLLILIASANSGSGQNQPDSATPVTIDFNELQPNTIVANQYLPRVQFSTISGASLRAVAPAFYSNGIAPFDNQHGVYAGYNTYVSFSVPVKNLTFNLTSFRSSPYGPAIYIDIYVNHTYYNYAWVYGSVNQGTVPVTILKDIPDITDIVIYYPQNYAPPSYFPIPLYYDDFNFTPDFNVTITNPRVSSLSGVQNALVGGSIVLGSSITPAGRTGGTYQWTVTGQYALITGTLQSSSITIRATDVGTLTAKVTYTLNGYTASNTVTINAIVPTLSSFNGAVLDVNVLNRGSQCSFFPATTASYTFGCFHQAADLPVGWIATAVIPSQTYLTDPALSGVKFKQAVNPFLQTMSNGRLQCTTQRSPQSDFASGWALDSSDPYNHVDDPPQFFGSSNSVTMADYDAPGISLDGPNFSYDAYFVGLDFEDYVYFFTGNPASPSFEYPKPLRLTNSSSEIARVIWRFGGTVYFDSVGNEPLLYREASSITTGFGAIPGTGSDAAKSMTRTFTGAEAPTLCAGAVDTHNPIDGSETFVTQLYSDFLGFTPDTSGLNFWTSQITRCVFDIGCIYGSRNSGANHGKRTDVAKAFFDAASFNQSDPAMANPPGSAGFNAAVYNPAFVSHCYLSFFHRPADQGGLSFWVNNLNSTGDYLGVIDQFANGYEFRTRFGAMDPHY
jgi:hypothetical protein